MVTTQLGERVMQHSSSERDYYYGGHGPDADSAQSPSGGAPPPIGQLADYYPVIAHAVHRLEQNTAQTRQTIYDRARAAMAAELHSLTPPLGESVIGREQLALERAIRKVETESLRCSPTPLQPSSRPPNALLGPIREGCDEQAKRPRSSADEDRASDLAFAKGLAMEKPDLAAELETLQKEIRCDRRGSLMIPRARTLVPLTIMGLLVLSIAASGAY
jgi:hypothetical protein